MAKSFECDCWELPGYPSDKRGFFENDYVVALFSFWPVTDYHFLVVPKRHVADEKDLTEREVVELHKARIKIAKAIKEMTGYENYNLLLNQGNTAGRTINHLHYHTVFRKEGDLYDSPLAKLLGKIMAYDDLEKIKEGLKAVYDMAVDFVGGIRNVKPGMGNYKKHQDLIPKREEDVLKWTEELKNYLIGVDNHG